MTPERIAEIYAEETGGYINENSSLCIEDFARRMWNEAIAAASVRGRIAQLQNMLVDDAIRALKLPEEP